MTVTIASPGHKQFLNLEFSSRCTYANTPNINYDEHVVYYRIVQDGVTRAEFRAFGKFNFNATDPTTITYPLTATPGTSTTVKSNGRLNRQVILWLLSITILLWCIHTEH